MLFHGLGQFGPETGLGPGTGGRDLRPRPTALPPMALTWEEGIAKGINPNTLIALGLHPPQETVHEPLPPPPAPSHNVVHEPAPEPFVDQPLDQTPVGSEPREVVPAEEGAVSGAASPGIVEKLKSLPWYWKLAGVGAVGLGAWWFLRGRDGE